MGTCKKPLSSLVVWLSDRDEGVGGCEWDWFAMSL